MRATLLRPWLARLVQDCGRIPGELATCSSSAHGVEAGLGNGLLGGPAHIHAPLSRSFSTSLLPAKRSDHAQSSGFRKRQAKQGSAEPPSGKPKGPGYGFDTKFSAMRTKDLQTLLERAPRLPPRRVLLQTPPVVHHGHEKQYSKTGEVIAHAYFPPATPQQAFAVVEAGHTQFKVAQDDKIYVHKLKGVDVNDVVRLNRVLVAGTLTDTLIGRPFVPQAYVRAAVEEHLRDSTVYIYKRRRAKGYRRFRGHRTDLTALRILEICGLESHGVEVPRVAVPDTRSRREIERERRRAARREVKERLGVVVTGGGADARVLLPDVADNLANARRAALERDEAREAAVIELLRFLNIPVAVGVRAALVSAQPIASGPWEEAAVRADLDADDALDDELEQDDAGAAQVRAEVRALLDSESLASWRTASAEAPSVLPPRGARDRVAALLHSSAVAACVAGGSPAAAALAALRVRCPLSSRQREAAADAAAIELLAAVTAPWSDAARLELVKRPNLWAVEPAAAGGLPQRLAGGDGDAFVADVREQVRALLTGDALAQLTSGAEGQSVEQRLAALLHSDAMRSFIADNRMADGPATVAAEALEAVRSRIAPEPEPPF